MTHRYSTPGRPPRVLTPTAGASKSDRQNVRDKNIKNHQDWRRGAPRTALDEATEWAHLARADWDRLHEPGQPETLSRAFAAFLDKVCVHDATTHRAFRDAIARLRAERPELALLLRYVLVEGLSYTAIGLRIKRHRTTVARGLLKATELLGRWFDDYKPRPLPELADDR